MRPMERGEKKMCPMEYRLGRIRENGCIRQYRQRRWLRNGKEGGEKKGALARPTTRCHRRAITINHRGEVKNV